MNKIQELETEIKQLKRKESIEAWAKWHEEGKKFLDSLIGKCFVRYSTVDTIFLFKVKSYKVQGVWGVNHHPGYFEIQTEGHFVINNTKWSPKIEFHSEGSENFAPFGTFSLISKNKYNKKNFQFDISALKYIEQGLEESCCVETSRVTKIGRYGVDKKTGKESYGVWECCGEKPTQSVASEFIGLFTYTIDEDFYNEAKSIADKLKIDTINLWKKFEKVFDDTKRIQWEVK